MALISVQPAPWRLFQCAFLFLLLIPPGFSADDPARFLLVTNWHATFTHRVNENGTLTYSPPDSDQTCTANWNFSHDVTVSCELAVDPQTLGHPYFRQFVWKTNTSTSIHLKDRFDQTCVDPDGDSTYQGHWVDDEPAANPKNFVLLVDTRDQTYSLGWVGAIVASISELKFDGGSIPGSYNSGWSPLALSSNALPSSALLLQGQDSLPMSEYYASVTPASANFLPGDPRVGGTSALKPSLLSGNLVLTWSLTPEVEELELVVEPVNYQKWLPEGNLKQPDQAGSSIKIVATLQQKGGGTTTQKADKFTFELANVSKEPGVCLNWPRAEQAKSDPDLKFEQTTNIPPFISRFIEVKDDTHAESIEPSTNAEVIVSCFDYGAVGTIKVKAFVGPKEIVGFLKTDTSKSMPEIPLPRRAPTSFVADYWKETEGVTDLSSNDDSDDDPPGDEHKGDGLSLYEEYRGFSIQGEHTRTKPKRIDLFVFNDGGTRGGQAITMFGTASGIKMRRLNAEEFGQKSDGTYTRIINYNHLSSTLGS